MKTKPSIYLCGAMENDKKLGAEWRDNITPDLEQLGFNVLNPVKLESDKFKGWRPNRLPKHCTNRYGKKVKVKYWHDLKHAVEPHLRERFKRYMNMIREFDTNLVRNISDYMLVLWDQKAKNGAGTHSEMHMAGEEGIPVYCVIKTELPAWIDCVCEERFSTMDEAKDFLNKKFGKKVSK